MLLVVGRVSDTPAGKLQRTPLCGRAVSVFCLKQWFVFVGLFSSCWLCVLLQADSSPLLKSKVLHLSVLDKPGHYLLRISCVVTCEQFAQEIVLITEAWLFRI